jgi:hypothetical protein
MRYNEQKPENGVQPRRTSSGNPKTVEAAAINGKEV